VLCFENFQGRRPEYTLIDLMLGHNPWLHGLGTERKGLVPEKLAEQSSKRRNLWGFLIERESQRMKTKYFLESNLFMNVVGFVKE
jgi:hypothetical protein